MPKRDDQQRAATSDEHLAPLVAALREVLRAGMPIRPTTSPSALLALDGVTARSVKPDDDLARVDALDRLVRGELRRLGLAALRRPAAALFGATSSSGANLTERRRVAATAAGYNLDHFRKRIEPQIVEQLAWQLHRDSLQYVQRRDDGLPFAASGDTPTIAETDIEQPADAEREVLLSRIWSDVYGLRAELITRESSRGDAERAAEFQEAASGALWYLARLLTNLDRFMERYGGEILHGAASFSAEGLIRMAGWTGEVTAGQARELRYRLARVGEHDRLRFMASLQMREPRE